MKTLDQLIQTLNVETKDKGINNALDLLSPFAMYNGEDWKKYYEAGKNEFQYAVLHKDEHMKLLLIYWNSFRKSEKHGHMKGGGLMKVLSGQVVETRFDPDDDEKVLGIFSYSEGDFSYIHDALGSHVVENREQIPAISLHLYCSGEGSDFGVL